MTPEVLVAVIAAVPPTLVALISIFALWLAHRKLDHITVLTNSTLTDANRKIAELTKTIADLKATISTRI